jgi:hypothetical protein
MSDGSFLSWAGLPWLLWLVVLQPALGMGLKQKCSCVDKYSHFMELASPEYKSDVQRRRLAENSNGYSRAALLHVWENVRRSANDELDLHLELHDASAGICLVCCSRN